MGHMREVPLSEAREGDTITVTARVIDVRASGYVEATAEGVVVRVYPPHVTGEIQVARSMLPTTPGSVGRATVCGVPDLRVMLSDLGGGMGQWLTAAAHPSDGRHWFDHDDITDYQPLLPGEVE